MGNLLPSTRVILLLEIFHFTTIRNSAIVKVGSILGLRSGYFVEANHRTRLAGTEVTLSKLNLLSLGLVELLKPTLINTVLRRKYLKLLLLFLRH